MLIILFRQEVNKTSCYSQESLGQQFEKQSNAMKRAFERKKKMWKKKSKKTLQTPQKTKH